MSLTSTMSTLAVKDNSSETSFESLDSNLDRKDWETWEQLKLSSYHGKKLIKRAYKPYHPKVKAFFLHELDNFDFEPNEKVTIVMRTIKKVLGNVTNPQSMRGKKINSKLSFVRVKGLDHFKAGKSIKNLIEFPDSYWEAHKKLIEAQNRKQSQVQSDQLKRCLETIPEKVESVRDSRANKYSKDEVSSLNIFRMKFEILPRIAKIIFEIIIFPFILIMAGLLIMNFTCKNAKKISKAEQSIVNI